MNPVIEESKEIVVKKRSGQLVPFYEERIQNAIEAAFKAYLKIPGEVFLDEEWKSRVETLTDQVEAWCGEQGSKGNILFIEDIQDEVVRVLRGNGYSEVGDLYQDYRIDQDRRRREEKRINVQKRNGQVVSFKPEKIIHAMSKAFMAEYGEDLEKGQVDLILSMTDEIFSQIKALEEGYIEVNIEQIQDFVEAKLMAHDEVKVARRYILYREEHRLKRENPVDEIESSWAQKTFQVKSSDGTKEVWDVNRVRSELVEGLHGIEDEIDLDILLKRALQNCFDGMKEEQVNDAFILAARTLVEVDPIYQYVASRVLLKKNYSEARQEKTSIKEMKLHYGEVFKENTRRMIEAKRLDKGLEDFDWDRLAAAIEPERDLDFKFLGLQTLYDRYFIHLGGRRVETPQTFFLRVAMGLALAEKEDKTSWAIEFYHILSSFLFMASTPTLFNAGTLHPQLSSCFLTTIKDDLDHIFKSIKDNAMLSKWSGGLGNDWTNVRAMGALINGTNGKSQGIVPFLKVANDTAVAVNQGGKRQGAVCAYLEAWHLDLEEFLELRKNTGDERRRTHDMHTANWIPDLLMERVLQDKEWTLFSPSDVPELHDLYGEDFRKKYEEYERQASEGKIKQFKRIKALELWRKMLSMLFETGHPWITFKDPSNLRSAQDHVGVVHHSNLCTEILLNTSEEESAVCNLGSINLVAHTTEVGLDEERLKTTVQTAMRMLDNVVDINYYPTEETRVSNQRHRPVGLGIMGFQDALNIQGFSYASQDAVKFADESMELISYYAILASTHLAAERGTYSSFEGSKWERGLLPIDTIALLKGSRNGLLEQDDSVKLDWKPVRDAIARQGMRNCQCLAIAPTATIANIIGVSSSIEPTYKNLYVKSNLSGEFTVINQYLVNELKALGLWNEKLRNDLKYFDGVLQEIEGIPDALKRRYPTAFEIDYEWIIECGSRRQKWIDMGQSLNMYLNQPSGKRLHAMYLMAWKKGLKTTYYLRNMGATRIEKSTVDVNQYKNVLGKRQKEAERAPVQGGACPINPDDDNCEACQ